MTHDDPNPCPQMHAHPLHCGAPVRERRAFRGQFSVVHAGYVPNFSRPDLQNSLKIEQIIYHQDSLTSNQILPGIPIRYIFLLRHPRDISDVNMLQYDQSPDGFGGKIELESVFRIVRNVGISGAYIPLTFSFSAVFLPLFRHRRKRRSVTRHPAPTPFSVSKVMRKCREQEDQAVYYECLFNKLDTM